MRTIDTWARHRAALLEARRLTAMVLANHPAFVALSQSGADDVGVRTALETELADDPVYLAWLQLEVSITAVPSANKRLALAVALIPGDAAVTHEGAESPDVTDPDDSIVAMPTSGASMETIAPDRPCDVGPNATCAFNGHPNEASVAIVRRECDGVSVARKPLPAQTRRFSLFKR